MALIISLVVFVAVCAAISLFGYHRYVLPGRLYQSLDHVSDDGESLSHAANPNFFTVSRAAEVVARKLPPSTGVASALQLKLLSAGYREQNAGTVFFGLKLLVTAAVTLGMLLFELNSSTSLPLKAMGLAIAVLAGFRLPDYFLARRIKQRQKLLRKGLPDALDLIVVCAEAGLTIDRSFTNVSHQLALMHPALCEEFSLFTAEISAGLRRKEALENLANRTQESELGKFVAVLTQADRFGTSMADALRTHADYLRMRRRQEAEEKASKVGVKLIFPIFFFIMPCMMLVTVGPAAMAIMRQLVGLFGGAQ
jgi:tight adherence protein C